MRGDFSRPVQLDARKRRYTTVFMQQGRVMLDADWNEQQQIHQYHRQSALADLIGESGGPSGNAGFGITVEDGVLTVGAGRYYVDGMLAERDRDIAYHEQPHLADPPDALDKPPDAISLLSSTETNLGLVYLDVWQRHVTAWDDSALREEALGGVDTTTRAETVSQARILPIRTQRPDIQRVHDLLRRQSELEVRIVAIEVLARLESRLGRLRTHVTHHVDDLDHRDRANPAIETLDRIASRLRERQAEIHSQLVDFYRSRENERALKALRAVEIELDDMMEELHTRIQELVRVNGDRSAIALLRRTRGELEQLTDDLHIQPRGHRHEGEDEELRRIRRQMQRVAKRLHADVKSLDDRDVDAFAVRAYRSTREELAQAAHTVARLASTLCDGPFDEWSALTERGAGTMQVRLERRSGPQGFRHPENQLIRVEIHAGSDNQNGPSFKWSRDNGSVVTGIESIDGARVTVHGIGPDEVRGFATGQWAEIADERTACNGQVGVLSRIVDVDPGTRVITLDESMGPVSAQEAAERNLQMRRWDGADLVEPNAWTPLEAGIEVQFGEGPFAPGDYWSIVTRADGIDWPLSNVDGGSDQVQPGAKHHYARLGLIALHDDALVCLADGRKQFGAATAPASAIHVEDVLLEGGGILRNDSELPVTSLVRGFSIVCDAALDPATVGPATCAVTLDMPLWPDQIWGQGHRGSRGADDAVGYLPLTIAAENPIEVDGGRIHWRPSAAAASWLESDLFRSIREIDRVLARITLKGNFIWNQTQTILDPEMYLDGEAYGRPSAGHTTLRLPSGDGRPGGDFEMWVWLSPVRDITLEVTPDRVAGRATAEGTVTLSGPAPREAATIRLHSNKSSAVVPETVTIPPHETSQAFEIDAAPVGQSTSAEIAAIYEEGESTTATLMLDPLLHVVGVRIVDTLSDPGARDFAGESFELDTTALSDTPITVPVRRPNVIEVRFGGAVLNRDTVRAGQTVIVETLQGTSGRWVPVPGRIDVPEPNVVRWMAHAESLSNILDSIVNFPSHLLRGTREELDSAAREGAAPPLPEGQYRLTLVGEGSPAITSDQQHPLDGEPYQLPSGDQVAGGNFTVELHIRRQGGR